jgi:cholinesterase
VTVIGESAGGGSIEHQITAYGGRGKVPFQQAILQSPGFKPKPDFAEQEAIFQKTLSYASLIAGKKIATVRDLAALSFTELFLTNYILVGTAAYGDFVFGPVVDGNFVPDLPGKLLIEGHFHHDLNTMVAYNSAEGLVFSSPFLQNTSDFDAYVQSLLPAASPSVITYITDVLYPDTTHGAQGYETQLARNSDFYSEFVFSCNTRYLDLAFENKTYAYIFSVPPGLHEIDVPYTFFNGDTTTVDDEYPVNATIAIALQEYITNFAITGSPNREAVNIPYFLPYGVNSSMINLGFAGFGAEVIDEAANSRCAWWQQALYT